MGAIIHEPHQKPILAWFENRLFLTDPRRQKVLCAFQVRTQHNGRELPTPEIALPEVNEPQAISEAGFKELPSPILNRRASA